MIKAIKRQRHCNDCKDETDHYLEVSGETGEDVWVCDECGKETLAV